MPWYARFFAALPGDGVVLIAQRRRTGCAADGTKTAAVAFRDRTYPKRKLSRK